MELPLGATGPSKQSDANTPQLIMMVSSSNQRYGLCTRAGFEFQRHSHQVVHRCFFDDLFDVNHALTARLWPVLQGLWPDHRLQEQQQSRPEASSSALTSIRCCARQRSSPSPSTPARRAASHGEHAPCASRGARPRIYASELMPLARALPEQILGCILSRKNNVVTFCVHI